MSNVETLAPPQRALARDVRDGLTAEPKHLPSRWLYDERGSRLFETITEQPEYYLTDVERAILAEHADDIAAAVPAGADVVELGSGTAEKTRVVLEAMLRRQDRVTFRPIDISGAALAKARERLGRDLPAVRVVPVEAPYLEGLEALEPSDGARLVLFIGSSIGNLEPGEAEAFLARVAATLGPDDRFLLATDLAKDPAVLDAAYDDTAGVTAAFDLNLLRRLNRELEATFDLDAFRHHARYDADRRRVEMHLVSTRRQVVRIGALDLEVSFQRGETIHTENSYKYTLDDVDALASAGNLERTATWTDAEGWYAVHLLKGADGGGTGGATIGEPAGGAGPERL